MHERVRGALEQLSPTDREVLVLRFLEQLSIKEATAVLDVSESALKMRQARGAARLQEIWSNEFEERQS